MNDLSTQSKSYVIKFHDGSKKLVTKEQYVNLLEAEAQGMESINFSDGTGSYKFSSIQKYLPLDEYYNQYPKERLVEYPNHEYTPKKPWKLARSKRAITGFLKGFESSKVREHGKEKWESMKHDNEHYRKILKRVKEFE